MGACASTRTRAKDAGSLTGTGATTATTSVGKLKPAYAVVVVGAGVAAGYLVNELVMRGYATAGNVLVVGRDAALPYERPALSKGYLFVNKPSRLPAFHTAKAEGKGIQDAAWYAKNGIDAQTGANVTEVDTTARKLTFLDANSATHVVTYEHLVLATGTKERKLATAVLGADSPAVLHLATEADAAALVKRLEALASSTACKNVVLVGGGYLGTELVAALDGWSAVEEIHVVMRDQHLMGTMPWPHVVTEAFEAAVVSRVSPSGRVKLHPKREVKEFLDGEKVVLDDGTEIPCAFAVVAIGSVPDVELGKAAGLEIDANGGGGFRVDGLLRTSAKNVWAAGECAHPFAGVDASRKMGRHVARGILAAMRGEPEPSAYEDAGFHYSRLWDYDAAKSLTWQMYGRVPKGGGSLDVRAFGLPLASADARNATFGALWFDKESKQVRAGVVFGSLISPAFADVRAAVEKGVDVDQVQVSS